LAASFAVVGGAAGLRRGDSVCASAASAFFLPFFVDDGRGVLLGDGVARHDGVCFVVVMLLFVVLLVLVAVAK
jgi:hypothetical protein